MRWVRSRRLGLVAGSVTAGSVVIRCPCCRRHAMCAPSIAHVLPYSRKPRRPAGNACSWGLFEIPLEVFDGWPIALPQRVTAGSRTKVIRRHGVLTAWAESRAKISILQNRSAPVRGVPQAHHKLEGLEAGRGVAAMMVLLCHSAIHCRRAYGAFPLGQV